MKTISFWTLSIATSLLVFETSLAQTRINSTPPAGARKVFGAKPPAAENVQSVAPAATPAPVTSTPQNSAAPTFNGAPMASNQNSTAPQTQKNTQAAPATTRAQRANNTQNAAPKKEEEKAKPFPLGFFYEWGYTGPRIGYPLKNSYDPNTDDEGSATVDHIIVATYKGLAPFSFGVQIAGTQADLDPTYATAFQWNDWRAFITWANIIDTDWFGVTTRIRPQFPTSTASKNATLFLRMDWTNTFTVKLPSEVVSWQFVLEPSQRWFIENNPAKTVDFAFRYSNTVGIQMSEMWSASVDLTLLTAHKYSGVLFDYEQSADDTLSFGLSFQPIQYISFNPGFNLFIDNPSVEKGLISFAVDFMF